MGKNSHSHSSNGNNKKKNGKKKTKKKVPSTLNDTASSALSFSSNFVSEAGPGCYIARMRHDNNNRKKNSQTSNNNDWVLGWEDVANEDFEEDEVPELAMDPDEKTLSVCNTRNVPIVAYITVYETNVRGRQGQSLPKGSTTNNAGVTRECITFIVLCPPHVFCHLCHLDVPESVDLFRDVELESDVQEWNQHPNPLDAHPQPLGFPLQSSNSSSSSNNNNNNSSSNSSNSNSNNNNSNSNSMNNTNITNDSSNNDSTDTNFLCTQGVGGELTHFFNGNLHAIDFRCPIGTPLLATGNGIVMEAKDHNTCTGISTNNLFEWNSIMLKLDSVDDSIQGESNDDHEHTKASSDNSTNKSGPLYVEYVHIRKSFVSEGDRVIRGQVIGESGSVGFSPEPHLHFAAYRSKDDTAPTVQVQFQSAADAGLIYVPVAGNFYDENGPK